MTELAVLDPATARQIGSIEDMDECSVDAAVARARASFDSGIWWPLTSDEARGQVLARAAALLRADAAEWARLECLDVGKPLAEAEWDIAEAARILEYYAGWPTKAAGEAYPVSASALSIVVHEPVGVVAAITPWNYPLLLAVQKIAPALAAGCSVLLKPAEQTPLTALRLPALLSEAGLPDDVFQIVTGGARAGATLVAHPAVDKVSFTGSSSVGRLVLRSAADTIKRVSVELGGKSPNIVFPDADLEAAISGTAAGVFANQGQICSSGSRVYVHASVYDDVLSGLCTLASGLRLGAGLDPATTMGPVVSSAQQERVFRYIRAGEREGRVAASGSLPTDPDLEAGFFVPPTVIEVPHHAVVAREEIFGPVMSVIRFTETEDVVRMANDSPYGLAAALWTSDISRALSVARSIRSGVVWVNDTQVAPVQAPWGGFKQSGIGRELGTHGLHDYVEAKHIYVNHALA
ncbi:MAG TPA: aldehyde dehydrogenase family protein [Nocardioidaceae bacterium]|nr:aldehyde dehydrogenase family protein [Nocardioidaceae bacterium]